MLCLYDRRLHSKTQFQIISSPLYFEFPALFRHWLEQKKSSKFKISWRGTDLNLAFTMLVSLLAKVGNISLKRFFHDFSSQQNNPHDQFNSDSASWAGLAVLDSMWLGRPSKHLFSFLIFAYHTQRLNKREGGGNGGLGPVCPPRFFRGQQKALLKNAVLIQALIPT